MQSISGVDDDVGEVERHDCGLSYRWLGGDLSRAGLQKFSYNQYKPPLEVG